MKTCPNLNIVFLVFLTSMLFLNCVVVEKKITVEDDGVLYSKKMVCRSRKISVLKYKKKNLNGVLVEKEKQILDIRGTWSTPIFVGIIYYDSITGKKKSLEKYWTEKIKIER
ncbi:hypothetical protein GCM10009118_34210 [Wandonia haliotis]|uniref:Lipoprotein n=1 Tax=Wandonia haliotis TaxID=574963 RepID=A0ABN1MUG9_9FLAO